MTTPLTTPKNYDEIMAAIRTHFSGAFEAFTVEDVSNKLDEKPSTIQHILSHAQALNEVDYYGNQSYCIVENCLDLSLEMLGGAS